MRAPLNESTGTSGESEVLAEFERLGWAGLIDSRHDIGTDLYLRPRDLRGWELGAVMGAQVKTGPSYFNAPQYDTEGMIIGWWYAESRRNHFDFWLRHALPHVLILRDQRINRSYWVHVTAEQIKSTGQGAKILVPISQIVNAGQNSELSDVALTQLPSPVWDGSAWVGAVNLSPVEKIRHALITPRLVAPHPNLVPEHISGVEALAMQILLREELERTLFPQAFAVLVGEVSSEWNGLSIVEARQSGEWCWRATAALHDWIYEGQSSDLLALSEGTNSPSERAAAAVLSCVYYFDENNPDAALGVLQGAFLYDDYLPADYAWLEAQRARALVEIGKDEEAFDLAMKTQRIHREVPMDATCAAIAGSAAQIAFGASGWMTGDLGNFVQRSDNVAAWWRSQVVSYGLSSHLSDEFLKWSDYETTRSSDFDRASRRLRSAALLASCAVDRNAWLSAKRSLAEHCLVATGVAERQEDVAGNLSLLRCSGDDKGVAKATKRIVSYGPTKAAVLAAQEVDLGLSTRTTVLADIELLTAAGDVLVQPQADEVCEWVLSTLRNPGVLIQRTRPTFAIPHFLLRLLRSIIHSVTGGSRRKIIDYVLEEHEDNAGIHPQELARILHSIPDREWNENDRQIAVFRGRRAPAYLSEAYLAVAAPADDASYLEMMRRARAGDLRILEAIKDIEQLPEDAVEALMSRLCEKVEELIGDARKGYSSHASMDLGRAITMLGAFHSAYARWDYVKKILGTPEVRVVQQSNTLWALAEHGAGLPADVQTALAVYVKPLCETGFVDDIFEKVDIRHYATEALAALVDKPTRQLLVRQLLLKDSAHRASCARIIERFGDEAESEILLALVGDSAEEVRDSALSGLSILVAAGKTSRESVMVLAQVLERGSVRSAEAIVSRLGNATAKSEVAELLEIAVQHSSARIRTVAAGLRVTG